jgi:hypothetical protein
MNNTGFLHMRKTAGRRTHLPMIRATEQVRKAGFPEPKRSVSTNAAVAKTVFGLPGTLAPFRASHS